MYRVEVGVCLSCLVIHLTKMEVKHQLAVETGSQGEKLNITSGFGVRSHGGDLFLSGCDSRDKIFRRRCDFGCWIFIFA
jgi:hypothetical protein